MRHTIKLSTMLATMVLTMCLPTGLSAQNGEDIRTIFDGITVVRLQKSTPVPIDVQIQNQSIAGETTLVLTGYLIVQFRAGELELVDEKGTARNLQEGEIFSVDENQTVKLVTDDDSAIITIYRIRELK